MGKEFSKEQTSTIGEALAVYGDELLKVHKKMVKLGLPEQQTIKVKYLGVQALRDQVGPARRDVTVTVTGGKLRGDLG
jgi:hypothetical protein